MGVFMKKIVLFDWGGVIEDASLEYDTIRDCLYMCGFHNIDSASVFAEYHKYDASGFIDEVTTEEELDKVLLEFLRSYDKNTDMEKVHEYKKVYKKHMANNPYYKEVSEYIDSLKGKVELGILSNVSLLDLDRQMKHINHDSFNYKFLSCELGMVKPSSELFNYVNEKLKDYEILFLDDREVNLEIPKSLGWKTYLVNKGGDLKGIKDTINEFLS